MLTLSFAHVLLQTFTCALLAIIDMNYLLYYLGVDMGLFLLYKIARKDFFYYANLRGAVRFIGSLTSRIAVKIVLNFTIVIQLRNPCEGGGVPFMFSILFSMAAR